MRHALGLSPPQLRAQQLEVVIALRVKQANRSIGDAYRDRILGPDFAEQLAIAADLSTYHGASSPRVDAREHEFAARDGGESCKPGGLRAGSAQQ